MQESPCEKWFLQHFLLAPLHHATKTILFLCYGIASYMRRALRRGVAVLLKFISYKRALPLITVACLKSFYFTSWPRMLNDFSPLTMRTLPFLMVLTTLLLA